MQPDTPHVIIAGGGLAGMAAAQSLAGAGFRVTLFESRPFLGGRASSFPLNAGSEEPATIDNCQHILLGCCLNLLDFYRRLGVRHLIRFFPEIVYLEPGGRASVLRGGSLPGPFSLAGSFLRLRFLSASSKLAVARALLAIRRQWSRRSDLDQITMLDWLRRHRQPPEAIARFWRPVLVSAVNEELETASARHLLQVFRLAFLGGPQAWRMGVPSVPLSDLYRPEALASAGRLEIRLRAPVDRIRIEDGRVCAVESAGQRHQADYYVCALPSERVAAVAPELGLPPPALRHSPITGIHLWFDRPVTSLAQAALLDRTIQWFFNKQGGRYLQLVVSASRNLIPLSRAEVVALALRELPEFLPEVSHAKLIQAHVVKEVYATFSPAPGLEALRPDAATPFPNLFLAGDWTRSGWPSTMEGAVRSGRLAAEAVTRAAGRAQKFLIPDRW